MRMQPAFGGRIELRLNDVFDSRFGRAVAEQVTKDTPGRGAVEPGLSSRPRCRGSTAVDGRDDLSAAQADGRRDPAALAGPRVARVHVLPRADPARRAAAGRPGLRRVPVGVARPQPARRLGRPARRQLAAPARLRRRRDRQDQPAQAAPQGLHGAQVAGRARHRASSTTGGACSTWSPTSTCSPTRPTTSRRSGSRPRSPSRLRKRLPGKDVTSQQLRERSWWKGLEVLFVVDDYDLVSTSTGNPLSPLVDYFAQGMDLGFHFVMARRMGGFARAQFEPMVPAAHRPQRARLHLLRRPDGGPRRRRGHRPAAAARAGVVREPQRAGRTGADRTRRLRRAVTPSLATVR